MIRTPTLTLKPQAASDSEARGTADVKLELSIIQPVLPEEKVRL